MLQEYSIQMIILRALFKNSKVICHLPVFQIPIDITLQCIWYTQEQARYLITGKTCAAKVSGN